MNIDYILKNKNDYIKMMKCRYKDSDLINQIEENKKIYVSYLLQLENCNKHHNILSKIISKIKKNNVVSNEDIDIINDLNDNIIEFDRTDIDLAISLIKNQISKIQLLKKKCTECTQVRHTNFTNLINKLPNLLHESVPVNNNEDNNEIVYLSNENVETKPLGQYKLSLNLGILEDATKISGNRGYFLTGDGVKLNYALLNYALDFMKKKDFKLMYTPHFMTHDSLKNICQLSDFDETLYKLQSDSDDKFLIATSEQPLTAYFDNKKILDLPVKLCGISTCFRKETGKHGTDTNGIFRVHQFEKVEQFCVTNKDDSYEIMEQMLENAKEFYDSLKLDYRVVNIVSGALNDAASKKYDIEGWFPGSNQYRELVSCSNTTDYLSRKIHTTDKHDNLVHMINSTLYANTRTICCLIETWQTDKGVKIPDVLVPYFGSDFMYFDEKKLNSENI